MKNAARADQFDRLCAAGCKYDMLKDEYETPAGLIIPAWPPVPLSDHEKQTEKCQYKQCQNN